MKVVDKLDELYPLIPEKDLLSYAKLFHKDLVMAIHNQLSSLPTILNPIYKIDPTPGIGVAISLGGTNGYVSSFSIDKKRKITFKNRIIFSLPQDTTKKSLFHLMTREMLKVQKKTKSFPPIGIGFAYPLKPEYRYGYIDGTLVKMTKGRNIQGLVGKLVGQEYHKFLIKEYGIDTPVAVGNDTICLLLGGKDVEIAGVVGTGINFSYWEKRERIAPLKLRELDKFVQSEIAVNIESREFDKIPPTTLMKRWNSKRANARFAHAEKEAAGAYLFQLFNAGKDKIIGAPFPDLTSTDQLNDIVTGAFYSSSDPDVTSGESRSSRQARTISPEMQKKAKDFAERIFHRSAQIVAIELCGILMKLGKTSGSIPVVMDGGMFWKSKDFTTLVTLYIHMILPEVTIAFARLFGSSRRGIAILARSG